MFLEVNTVVFMYHRITLEDDDEDEDLGVEPAVKRPVLVILDSLKEGLQRGITDILPHTVAQSMYVIVLLLDELANIISCACLESFPHDSSFVFFSPGANHAWNWCCGVHQMTCSLGSKRTPHRNYVNNRLQCLNNP